MVRLKVVGADGTSVTIKFQFLMVRLKALCRKLKREGLLQVSIPYGSIKSQLRNEYEPQKIVSIPYGSIKRNIPLSFEKEPQLFQFLMVRLKAYILNQVQKSGRKFQFLMVRLKEDRINKSLAAIRFQFLMVRLKAASCEK